MDLFGYFLFVGSAFVARARAWIETSVHFFFETAALYQKSVVTCP